MFENFSFEDFKRQLKENNKLRFTTYGLGTLIVLSLGYFTYRQFVWEPSNEKSKDAYWSGLNYAAKDSTDQAIALLEPAVKNYDGKEGGELAQFVLARQYMAKGDFTKALEELEGVDIEDTYLSIYKIGLQGDCKSELKKYDEALNLYIEAAELNENEKTSPEYLFKAGLVAELELKDFAKATEMYEKIRDNYATYAQQKAIEKYIARASNKK